MYRETKNPGQILMLNELMREHAKDVIVSAQRTPYGDLTDTVADLVELIEQRLRNEEGLCGINVYMETDRCWIPASSITVGIKHITFRTNRMDLLRALPSSEQITELTAFESGHMTIMARGARFIQLAVMPSGDTIIELEWFPNLPRQ
jgi:hypothetical protein